MFLRLSFSTQKQETYTETETTTNPLYLVNKYCGEQYKKGFCSSKKTFLINFFADGILCFRAVMTISTPCRRSGLWVYLLVSDVGFFNYVSETHTSIHNILFMLNSSARLKENLVV